jgi:hypothetical protein
MNTKQYFYRNVIFSKQGKTISIVDINNPKNDKEELDPWFAMVLQLADGQHTVEQLMQFMATQYNGMPPENLTKTLESVIERMADTRLIMLTEKPTELPYYLSMPYELLDVEKAKAALAKDRINLN